LNAWQLFALFGAVILTIAGISLFSLGAMFNYLVALFHKRPMRRGLFGTPIFDPPLDRHFGWMGIFTAGAGVALGIAALILSLKGWEITRLWFYLLISASLVLIGLQLSISWIVMRVLEELSKRETFAQRDLIEAEPANVEAQGLYEAE
jgi:hypothetical protein